MKNGHPQELLLGDIIKTHLSVWNHRNTARLPTYTLIIRDPEITGKGESSKVVKFVGMSPGLHHLDSR